MTTLTIPKMLQGIRTHIPAHSLRGDLLRTLAIILMATLFLFGVLVYVFTSRSERAMWAQRQVEAADFAANEVTNFVERTQDYLRLAGSLPVSQIEQNPEILSRYLFDNTTVLEIIRTDTQGKIIASADGGVPILANLFTLSQSNWFQQARSGKFYIGDLQISMDGEPYLVAAVPARDGGVTAARVRMDLLWEVTSRIRFGQSGYAYVVTDDGALIAHPTPEFVLANTNLAGHPAMRAITAAPQHQWTGSYTNFQGEQVQGTSRSIPGLNWIILTELSSSEVYASTRRAQLFLLLAITSFGVCTMATLFVSMRHVVLKPVEALCAASERVGQGDFAYRVTIRRHDEIGQVAHAFNAMAAGLSKRDVEIAAKTAALAIEIEEHKETQRELEQLNRTLEQRVSERTRELELLTTDLMRSNRELQEFAYIASHDLQEPLRKVRAFGDRLVERYSDVLDARGKDYVARMQASATRMQTLIDALLTYSRIATKGQPFVNTNLNDIVRDVVSDLETRLEQFGGQIKFEDLGTIEADPLQMRQLLQNLIGNGLKFHRPDIPPIVTLYGETCPSSDLQDPNQFMYRLTVEDNGIGFEPQYAEQIFQVFQRLHGRDEFEGTGVGLAICRKIVERHGGTILASSTLGDGAKFIITLPISRSPKPVEKGTIF